jgi:phosphate transport system substrate-binding protein
VNAVVREKHSIGYGGAAYAKGLKILKVKKDKRAAAIALSDQTVRDGSYSLSRPLFFYTRATPSGDTKAFIEWVLSPAGQAIATKVGYFPIR